MILQLVGSPVFNLQSDQTKRTGHCVMPLSLTHVEHSARTSTTAATSSSSARRISRSISHRSCRSHSVTCAVVVGTGRLRPWSCGPHRLRLLVTRRGHDETEARAQGGCPHGTSPLTASTRMAQAPRSELSACVTPGVVAPPAPLGSGVLSWSGEGQQRHRLAGLGDGGLDCATGHHCAQGLRAEGLSLGIRRTAGTCGTPVPRSTRDPYSQPRPFPPIA